MIGVLCVLGLFICLHNTYHFVSLLNGSWNVVTHLLSEDIEEYFLSIFKISYRGLPWCLALCHQIFDLMCWTMNQLSNFPHTCCCSCCSLYYCCCFHFLFLSCFCHFSLTPMLAFGPGRWSWFMSIFSFARTNSQKWK